MKHKNTQVNYWKGLFVGLLVGILLIFGMAWIAKDAMLPANSEEQLVSFEETVISVAEKTQDAVVSVGNYQYPSQQATQIPGFPPFFGRQYGYSDNQGIDLGELDQEPQLIGMGSGVIYKVEGDLAYIVTNNHVIEGADQIDITLHNGEVVEATIIGSDELSDLAVLTIASEPVDTVAEFADSDQLRVGQLAIAIGSPIDEDYATSVTQGIVSGLNRPVPVSDTWEMNLLQTDAAINPGNSGGALLNSQGQVIGINTIKLAAAQIEGMGFAIPSNEVVRITQQLETEGEVTRPSLGVSLFPLFKINPESRTRDLNLDPEFTDGVVVMDIQPGSAADHAGVQLYDVITKINDTEITDFVSLRRELFNHHVGETIQLTVLRQGEEIVLDVELIDEVDAEPAY